MEKNIFEIATRKRLRFLSQKGNLSVEDLWILQVVELDNIFKDLNMQLKESKEESLLNTRTSKDEELEIKIEIIKHIVSTKLKENENRLNAKKKKEDKQKILKIIASKKDTELENKSLEELLQMVESIDKE